VKEPERFMTGRSHLQVFLSTKSESIRKHFSGRPGLRPLALALLLVLTISAVQTPVWSAGVTDRIWLESNSTAGNSILTFKNDGNGNPTFLGSTPADGIGVFDKTFALGPFDSDQNLIVSDDGTLLFAVNSGSNSIAVFRITPNGLQAVEGSPFASGGSDPVSLA
jgi:hypothetical protein